MKATATTGFAGPDLAMAAGETRDVPEDAAAPLVACGYLVPAEEKKTKKKV